MKEENLENQKNVEDEKTLVEDSEILTDETNENEIVEDEKSLKDKIIDRKTALLVAGGTLLAGTGFAAGVKNKDEILLDTDNDNIADTILTDENEDGIYNTETEIEEIEAEPEFETNNESSNSHTFNIDTAPHASDGTVTDDMSFSEAFASAREELGAGGVFEWNGQLYGTFYATEVDENHNPIIDYPTTNDANYQTNTENIETVEPENENPNPENENEEEITEINPDDTEEVTEVEPENIDEIIGEGVVDTGEVNYDGEIADNVPDDVPDTELDDHNDDLIALNDDFDDINDWA